jgi:DNA transformation protein
MKTTPFVDFLLNEAFVELEDVQVKNMFGGHGFYLEGRIFGFTIDEETLVLKADDENNQKFKEAGSTQFVYEGHKKKGPVAMPYWTAPDELYDDPVLMAEWARASATLSQPKK